ncbi:MAG: carboxypeptidase-like regulatory domain-containing protein [Mangrovibacterium sp.]|nr:carboxypeptidase-like regulatory domain-containing protein [Mangrovibacterium sp.]
MKKLFLSFLLVGCVVFTYAGKKENKKESAADHSELTTISGQVLDQRTNETLVGVKVALNGTDKVAYTNFDGKYSFKNIKPGTYELTASYISYAKSTVQDLKLNKNTNQVNILMKDSN